MARKKRIDRPRRARRRRSLGPLAPWAAIVAVAGAAILLLAWAATSGGSDRDDFVAQIAETPSDASEGEPFQGGPRLYFPVEGVDLGRVPLRAVVSHSFDLRNVGDATLRVEDVEVKMLEGC